MGRLIITTYLRTSWLQFTLKDSLWLIFLTVKYFVTFKDEASVFYNSSFPGDA